MLMAAFNLVLLGTDDVKILDLVTAYLTVLYPNGSDLLIKGGSNHVKYLLTSTTV